MELLQMNKLEIVVSFGISRFLSMEELLQPALTVS
jgi:hypothetical protein